MMDLVPTFGIDAYADRVARLMADAPREMPIVEGVVLGGLGAGAVVLALIALIRRSAIAAVGFSFLALIGLICALLFGRLDFVPMPTQVLVVCLAACGMLLFLTATIRVARDNPLMGILVLVALASLLAIGGSTAAGIVDDARFMRIGVAGAFGLTAFCILVELLRRDRPSLVIAPGLLAVMGSPFLMSYVANGPAADWITVAMPIMVLAGGAFYAAFAAIAVLAFAKQRGQADADPVSAPTVAPVVAPVAMMRSTPPEDSFADAGPVDAEADGLGPFQAIDDHVPQHRPAHNYAATPNLPPREPAPAPAAAPAHVPPQAPSFGQVEEPVSASWGAANAGFATSGRDVLAPNEYVWDQLAAQEVKMGDEFANLFSVPHGVTGSPDFLREAITPESLGEFDEQVLGGAQPVTGRFDVHLTTADGRGVHLQGRRQIDHDGLLIRVEASATQTQRAAAVSPPLSAQRASSGLAAAAPLTATRGRARPQEDDYLEALDRGQIQAHFQPIVRLADRVTVGFEALARWHRPDGSIVDAKDFVPALISKGHGIKLLKVILDSAAAELASWIEAQPDQGQFVSVNIAASDLPQDELATIIRRTVGSFNLPAGALVVELTEGRIQASQSTAVSAAKALREAGASLAVDDFGVGYSTLNRLSKFQFDLIKTDSSLIRDLTNKKARSFMKTLLATAKKKGSPVIAEGVEDEETARLLDELGCEFGQGYLFGRAEALGAPASSAMPATDPAAPPSGRAPVTNGLR